jgi:hypothetical protein
VRAGRDAINAEPSLIIDRCFGVGALDHDQGSAERPTVDAIDDYAHRSGELLRLYGRRPQECNN